ncbi:glutamine-synthetase adenylyltransferase [Pseudonocardia sp. TMWB2A]|uniref:bifunctional [glutamine synthetase] adenylyltransferase/[glutamine synthetase]-adenylyl-L-tyrosine phosphorylase n=1 Tax=Pseudonocardia sp. TMWB2A TaxID=687430 RepID=UPI00307DD0D8
MTVAKMSQNERLKVIERARSHAPFLARLGERFASALDHFVQGTAQTRITALLAERWDGEADIMPFLRDQRSELALLTALLDLSGEADLTYTIETLSAFADQALDDAVRAAFDERVPGEPVQGFAVIGLGKHGSHELNYSSDIDPILLFDPVTMPRRERDDPVEAAVRMGRRVTEILSARTGEGYVFRVDLRLRPTPEVTPIVLPVNAAIGYYESQALAWEQAAFIRARACAGDKALGRYFLDAIRPFVWRKSLDYRQIKEIGSVSQRIRDHYAGGQKFGPGYDLKRGRGGIREVEFFAQVHQLIHGGRDASLRVPATRDALAALAKAGRIDADEAEQLAESYALYRTIEHRLQMVDDQQTHSLPKDSEALDRVARLHGLKDGAALIALLAPHVERVGKIYDRLIAGEEGEESQPLTPRDDDALTAYLSNLGFAAPESVAQRIAAWRSGKVRALRSGPALEALETALPKLLTALSKAPDPMAAVMGLDRMIDGLPSTINFFHLLDARPALATTLGNILTYAPALAEQLGRRSALLDGLIDQSVFNPNPSVEALLTAFSDTRHAVDYERHLDHVRRLVGERRFALGVQIIDGMADPMEVARGYAHVAEAALVALADATRAEFEAAHGRVPDSEFVILALGRLGGEALTHASDLDLIYLFTGDYMAESDGAKPLGATLYYNRLAQRVSAALSVPTATGRLYEVDTRLRPSGAQGPLAVTLDAFERYQKEEAWVWEHMALTRARPVYGSNNAREAVQAIIDAVLKAPRDAAKLRADAAQMRADMAGHKPPSGPLDAKLIAGGLVDLEFATHVTQLTSGAGLFPQLDRALPALVEAGLAPDAIVSAQQLLTRLLVTLRLVCPDCIDPPDVTKPVIARACQAESWEALLADYDKARAVVAAWWDAVRG